MRLFLARLFFFILLLYNFPLYASVNDKNNHTSYEANYFIDKANKSNLWMDDYWKILLHYKEDESVIRDDFFFLSKDGHKNPKVELEETIKGFFLDVDLDDNHPVCRYPARLKWISQNLNMPQELFLLKKCHSLNEYLRKTSAKKISLSFASENVNNLVSMMGHIFLKISGESNGLRVEHSLSYFANFSSQNSISFILNVLFSGVPGVYILDPYSKKLSEYNDNQKRSIWEYELNLTLDEVEMIMLHIWEMKKVNAKYSFITHNCGSALLYLLYVAKPSLQDLYNPLDAPIDIVKNLYEKSEIVSVELFPADNYKFRMISKNFSKRDKALMKNSIDNGDINLFNRYDVQKKSNIMYALQTVVDYKVINNNISEKKYKDFSRKIRSESEKLPSNNLKYEIKNPLNKSKSSQVRIGYKNENYHGDVLSFGFYPVYNDLNLNNSEYFNEFRLQLTSFKAGYYKEQNKIIFDNFDLINIKSVIPYDILINGLSGSLRVNLERETFSSDSSRMFPNFDFGVGSAKDFFDENIMFYYMANFGYSYFLNTSVLYTNPEIGFILKEGGFGKLIARHTRYFSDNKYKYEDLSEIEQTFFLKSNNNILISLKRNSSKNTKNYNEVSMEYLYNF